MTEPSKKNPVVSMATSLGDIKVELFADKAPITVNNFLTYVKNSFYNGLIFHRVIAGFMIQGGGFDNDMRQKPAASPTKNEAASGLKNKTGTLAMARTSVVDSATCQFFINVADNNFLDHQNTTPQGFGYAVFGQVIEGMEVVRKIEAVKTGNRGLHQNVPLDPVVIHSVRVEEAL